MPRQRRQRVETELPLHAREYPEAPLDAYLNPIKSLALFGVNELAATTKKSGHANHRFGLFGSGSCGPIDTMRSPNVSDSLIA